MIQVLHANHNGELYKRRVLTVGDIADLIRENHLETLTSRDGQVDFWFTPSTQHGHRCVNRKATEIFLATTEFTVSNVPLLRGIVVLTAHTHNGELASLTDDQVDRLARALNDTTWWQCQILSWRYRRDQRRQRRADQSGHARPSSLGFPRRKSTGQRIVQLLQPKGRQ